MPRLHLLLALLAWLPGVSLAEEAAGASELSVLTYNVHGLASWLVSDQPERRLPQVSRLINAYDVALIQEDFSYPELLRESAEHAVVVDGNGSRFASASLFTFLKGSGLTTFVDLPPERIATVLPEPYGSCSGWFAAANDCWATKGFLLVRLRIAPDLELDVVQTHLDAGRSAEDRQVRARQLDQLRARLIGFSAGRALIVAGDLNLRRDDPADRALLAEFVDWLSLHDTGARGAGDWRGLDYILYRGGEELGLEVLEAGEAPEFVHGGEPLSDHPALFTRFRLAPAGSRP